MGDSSRVKVGLPASLAAVALLAAACHLNTIGNQFAFDDLEVIVRNPLVTGGGAGRLAEAFSSHYWAHVRESGSLYRPLTILTYALNHALSGLAPWSYHAVNIALHAAATALVTLLGLRLRIGMPAALAAGLLFAVHPVHTEAVAGVVGRAELLAACGVLGAWVVHLGGSGWRRGMAAGLLFAAGLFSKENAVVLPALLILGDLWRSRAQDTGSARRDPGPKGTAVAGGASSSPSALRERVTARGGDSTRRPARGLPSYAACLVVLALWGALRAGALPPGDPSLSDSPLAGESSAARVLTALHVLARYAVLQVFPVKLSADYSFNQIPIVRSPDAPAIAGAALLACAFAAAARVRRGRTSGLLAAGWIVAILPVSNLAFPIGTLMAERLLYLPSAFLCLAAPLAWRRLAAALVARGVLARPRLEAAGSVLLVALVLAGAGRTLARNADWRDQLTLFEATVRTSPRSARARYNLGVALEEANRHREALARYQEALAIDPADRRSHHNAGLLLAAGGSMEDAARHLELALRMDPSLADAAASLGAVYVQLGRDREAERVMRDALPGASGDALHRLEYNLGSLLLRQDRIAEAVELLERARDARPGDADGRYQLGLAWLRARRWDGAREEARHARALSPALAEANVVEGIACLRLGDVACAAAAAARARAAGLDLPPELRELPAAP